MKGKNSKKKKSKSNFELKDIYFLIASGVLLLLGIALQTSVDSNGLLFSVAGERVYVPVMLLSMIILCGYMIKKSIDSDDNVAVKSALSVVVVTLISTWLIPTGNFDGTSLQLGDTVPLGVTDLPTILYHGIYFTLDRVMFIIAVMLFYIIAAKAGVYKKSVDGIASSLKGKEKIYTVFSITLLVLLTSLVSNTFVLIFFIPFMLSIFSKLKIEKMTAFAATIGAVLIGLVGVPYGSEGLTAFNQYSSLELETGLMYRAVIAFASYVLFVAYVVLQSDKNKKGESLVDPILTIEKKSKKSTVPFMSIIALTSIFIMLGFIAWETNFEITEFREFHESLVLTDEGEATIVGNLLGTSAQPLGAWDLFTGTGVVLFMALALAISYKVKITDIFKGLGETSKLLASTITIAIAVCSVFVIAYITQYYTTIGYVLFDLLNNGDFNPNTSALAAFMSSVLHFDMGFTAYVASSYYTVAYASNMEILSIIFMATYGLVQIIMPTSMILFVGLAYTNINYKLWLKYIALFFASITLALLLAFNVLTYMM